MTGDDGKHWAERDDDAECLACARQWQRRALPQRQGRDVPIDTVGIEHKLDLLHPATTLASSALATATLSTTATVP